MDLTQSLPRPRDTELGPHPARTTPTVLAVLLAMGVRVTGEASGTSLAITDHFQCYWGDTPKQRFANKPVQCIDQFGATAATGNRPLTLWNPINKNNEVPTAPSHPDHLVGYRLGGPERQTLSGLKVTNQFGEQRLDAFGPTHLLVPTATRRTGTPPVLQEPAVDISPATTSDRRVRSVSSAGR